MAGGERIMRDHVTVKCLWMIFISSLLSLNVARAVESADAQPTPQDPVAGAEPRAGRDSSVSPTALEEIIVTAQKREQKISDIGFTIVSQTGLQLKEAGIDDIGQLDKVSTGFTASESPQGIPIFTMRGVGFNGKGLSATPTVSTYVDEAVLPYPVMTAGMLLDVERVEILKGPQGTLFGQNATGGAINIVAAKPTNYFTAGVESSANNFGGISANGYVSGPLGHSVDARLAISTDQFGAWQHGYYLNDSENGTANRGAARLLLDWSPSDTLKVSLNVNGNYDNGQPPGFLFAYPSVQATKLKPGEQGLLTYPASESNTDADMDVDQFRRNRFYQTVLRAEQELAANLSLVSITDYAHMHFFQNYDGDGTALNISPQQEFGRISSFSQELRVVGEIPQHRIHYIVGGNYYTDSLLDDNVLYENNYSGLPIDTSLDNRYATKNYQKAFFINADWEAVERVTFTGGARYTWTAERQIGCLRDTGDGSAAAFFGGTSNYLRSLFGLPPTSDFVPGGCVTIDDRPLLPGGIPSALPYLGNDTLAQKNVSWRGGVNYKPTTDSLIYGLVSRGFKAGGYPATVNTFATQGQPVLQEELTSYEVGTKAQMFGGALAANAAIYYYDYVNKQFSTYIKSIFGEIQTTSNVPHSTVKGFEVDLTAVPISGVKMRAALTYADTALGHYLSYSAVNGALTDVSGNPFNYAPEWSGIFNVEYRLPIGHGLESFVGSDVLYEDKAFSDLAQSEDLRIPTYTTVDVRAGLEAAKRWRMSLWVRNVADKFYWTGATNGVDDVIRVPGMPRTFGVTVGYTF
jgi:outer membrane receptor protein involved in Fe transport